MVKDGSGTVRQRFDYYPYGSVSRVYTNSGTTDNSVKRYRFGGKEIAGTSLTDLAGTGAAPGAPYLDFGARLYSPGTASWLSVDPLAEMYYRVGPLTYCAANPVNLVDPTGGKIFIQTGETSIEYTANQRNEMDDPFIQDAIDYLNDIYNSGGSGVMDDLMASAHPFLITNAPGKGGNLQFAPYNSGGGQVLAGAIMTPSFDSPSGVEYLAHELFHAIQYEKGQGGANIYNEVEAYAYGTIIYNNYLLSYNGMAAMPIGGNGENSFSGRLYEQAFSNLISGKYTMLAHMGMALSNFKQGARVNATGLYNSFIEKPTSISTSLLAKYYPPIFY